MKYSLKTSIAALPLLVLSSIAYAQAVTGTDVRNTYSYTPPAAMGDIAPAAGETATVNTKTTTSTTTYDTTGTAAPVTTTRESTHSDTIALPAVPSDGVDFVPTSTGLERQAGSMTYATGGVGEEERAQLKSLSGKYNTQILTTASTGAYIGDYTVSIADAKGNAVFEAPGDGPYVYVNLPAGTYDVTVTRASNSDTKKQRVSVGKGSKNVKFTFAGE